MATVPLSGSNIRFIKGVPFTNDYKNTRWFDTKSQQTSYFTSKPEVHSMNRANFVRIEGSNKIAVDKHIDDLWGTNYLMFQNASYYKKWFYAFVTKIEYENKFTTWVHFEIDVFQTWCFDMNFKPSFVKREHRKLWESDGTPVINTIDEGLNYGTEYDTVYVRNVIPKGGYKYMVIVAKNTMHSGGSNEIEPTIIGTPQPLSYYVVPFNDAGNTPNVILELEDGGTDSFPITPPERILKELYKDDKAVNNIVAIYVTDSIGVEVDYTMGGSTPDTISFPSNADVSNVVVGDSLYMLYINEISFFDAERKTVLDNKYSEYETPTESKLLMYPYCVTVVDDFKGNRTTYKNEYIMDKDLTLILKGSLGASNKTSWGVRNYNRDVKASYNDDSISNESALINNTPSDLPVINDMLAAFLQGNRNSLENQKSSITWNGVMNGIGNAIAGANAGAGRNVAGVASSGANIIQGAGNTVLQLQAIEAKQQDIGNIPPQIAKMGSNTAYDYGHRYNGVWVIQKQIKPEYQKKLSDFFNMFGYKTNEVKVPNFHTRENWNYVETTSCVITGDFNNEDLTDLKAIFDNGITLWHTDDVGNYSLSNGVI